MSKRIVTLIPGDGIGPEVTDAAKRVVEAAGGEVEWDVQEAGLAAISKGLDSLPVETIESIKRNKVALKGPLGTPVGGGHQSVNLKLRKLFQTYANVRPIRSSYGDNSRYKNVDLVIVREATEDFYDASEQWQTNPVGVSATGFISQEGTRRVAEFAYRYAREHGRKKVTVVHKANILKEYYGFFLAIAREVGRAYPDIVADDLIVDNCGQQLVLRPDKLDVLLTPNLFGDILSDVAAALVGGLGFAPGANIGDEYAIFEAVHGTAPDIVGKNLANPCAVILSAALMLRRLGQNQPADSIEEAVEYQLKSRSPSEMEGNFRKITDAREFTNELCDYCSE